MREFDQKSGRQKKKNQDKNEQKNKKYDLSETNKLLL